MIETLDIIYSVTGQSIYFDAPERAASITSSTVYENQDGDDGTAESATTGSAAVETNPNTTLDGAAAAGAVSVPLTATTGITVGRRYLMTNADGESEWVEIMDVDSGNAVTIREPLANTYAAADTFEGTRISHAIDSTWVADSNNISENLDPNPRYRWRIEYVTAGGDTRVYAAYFDLVRYTGTHTVTGLDVDRAFPGWLRLLPTFYRKDQGKTLITEAYRQVKLDLYSHGKADQMARNAEVTDDLVLHKAALLGVQAAVYAGGDGLEAVELAAARYMERMTHLIQAPKIPFSTDSGGGAVKVTGNPVFRR